MTIKRSLLLLLVFVVGLAFWLVWYLPASVVVKRLPAMVVAGATLNLDDAVGRSWDGSADWRWRGHVGELTWRLNWHGWTPGVDVTLRGAGLNVSGWVTAGDNRFKARQLKLQLPLALLLDGQPAVSAGGVVGGQIATLAIAEGHITALKGTLHYTGGNGRWLRQSAILPAMQAQLSMQGDTAQLRITNTHKELLAQASVDAQQMAKLQIFRAFAVAVGMSNGAGNNSDAIMTLGQQLDLNF